MEGYAAAALLALLVLLTIFVAVSDVMLPNVSDLRRKSKALKNVKKWPTLAAFHLLVAGWLQSQGRNRDLKSQAS